jgi:hypothetical protein
VEIHTAEPLSAISVGDYLYEVSFPDPLAVPRGLYFAGGGKAACDFNTHKGSSDAGEDTRVRFVNERDGRFVGRVGDASFQNN